MFISDLSSFLIDTDLLDELEPIFIHHPQCQYYLCLYNNQRYLSLYWWYKHNRDFADRKLSELRRVNEDIELEKELYATFS